jgi:hypothetical protein
MISPAFYVLDFERLLLPGKGFDSEAICLKADSSVKREVRESFGDRLLHHAEIVLIDTTSVPVHLWFSKTDPRIHRSLSPENN